jgi:AcrR family transcriptional regulator
MARPRLHDAALRARLLDVTSEAVAGGGESAVTVRSVAAAAGTSASAVYALFGSREDLVAAVSAEGFRRFAAHLAAVPHDADPGAELHALGLAYRTSALADPHFYRVMFDRGVPADDEPATRHPTFVVLRDAVARALGPAPAEQAQTVAIGLWALAHGLVSLELAGLLPGSEDERAARYEATLLALGSALAGAAQPPEAAASLRRGTSSAADVS